MQQGNFDEGKDMSTMSVEEMFLGIQESYAEAQQRALEENKLFNKAEFFRMDKIGVYRLRVLPIAPKPDGSVDRRSYEYPVHQMLLELEKPSSGTKRQLMYVTVPRTTDAGFTVDIIDTYRKLAIETAKDRGDEKLADKIAGGTFGGGLKYTYGHAMYIFDMDERAKGPQLLTLSHSQFKDLDERKFKLWQKKLTKNPNYPCPVSSINNAYPVEIEKKKNGTKTEYIINIDNESDNDMLSREELSALMAAPRIPEIIYRYSRYQFEATIVFLKQCDVTYDMNLMETDEMKDAVEKLRAELPKEDTSTFSFDKRNKDNKESAANGISLDSLFDRYEELKEQGLGDKTEEGQELRALIRAFIEQEKLSVRVTRSTTNAEILDMIETALQEGPAEDDREEPEPEPAKRREDAETDYQNRERRGRQENEDETGRNRRRR